MMTERKTVSVTQPPEDERENSERLFSTDPEVLRLENARLQRDLTRALEERNRLLKNRGLPTGHSKGAGLRVLEERLEVARAELNRFKQERKVQEEKLLILQDRLTTTGRIPGIFIARLEDAVVSSGGVSETAGNPVENAADAPDRIAERFDAAVDALWQLAKRNSIERDKQLRGELEILKESLEYKKNESNLLREEQDLLAEQMGDLQTKLQRSEAEVELRQQKLNELQGRLEEQEEENKKQAASILKLKSQLNMLRGSVSDDFFSRVTGSSSTPAVGTHGWSKTFFSSGTVAGVLLGLMLSGGGLWLYGNFTPAPGLKQVDSASPPVDSASSPPGLVAPLPSKVKEKPAAAGSDKPYADEEHRDNLRAGGKGPVLIKLPGDSFTMGTDRYAAPEIEKPAHPQRVDDFHISRFEVSFDQYDAFARASGVELPSDHGWGRGGRPVINVSWENARAYTDWLSRQTGHRYRLPTEAEWEYAMGGGSEDIYWWGNSFKQGQEICFNCGTKWDGRSTAPVGSAEPNAFGLYDMGGNVMEWVGDCLADNAASSRGCKTRVVRGGAFNKPNDTLRITARRGLDAVSRHSTVGFRVVREAGK